jgi:hypothetical protein
MAAVFIMMAVLGTLFAVLDIGFNESKNYAGFWLVIAIIGVGGCWWMGVI